MKCGERIGLCEAGPIPPLSPGQLSKAEVVHHLGGKIEVVRPLRRRIHVSRRNYRSRRGRRDETGEIDRRGEKRILVHPLLRPSPRIPRLHAPPAQPTAVGRIEGSRCPVAAAILPCERTGHIRSKFAHLPRPRKVEPVTPVHHRVVAVEEFPRLGIDRPPRLVGVETETEHLPQGIHHLHAVHVVGPRLGERERIAQHRVRQKNRTHLRLHQPERHSLIRPREIEGVEIFR